MTSETQAPGDTAAEAPAPAAQHDETKQKIEAWYSVPKGALLVAFYTLALGGATYIIGMQLIGLGVPKFLVSIFALAFLYMLALQIRTFMVESRAGAPTFVVTEDGIKLRPLAMQLIPWKDIAAIEVNNPGAGKKQNPLSALFGKTGYVAVTVKANARSAPAVAEWTKGKGEANEFFLSANLMKLDVAELQSFVVAHAPKSIVKTSGS